MRLRDFRSDIKKIANQASHLAELVTDDVLSIVPNSQMKQILSSALDIWRPFIRAIGYRVQKISKDRAQMLVPAKFANLRTNQEFFDGIIIQSAQDLSQLLIQKWNLPIMSECISSEFQKWKTLKQDLILRTEWDELTRESLRAQILNQGYAEYIFHIYISDLSEQRCAEAQMTWRFQLNAGIDQKKKEKNADHS